MDAMTSARAKAPTLVWLLTALTCLLAGMAVVESRHQTVALPVFAPVGPVEPIAAASLPITTTEVPLASTPEPPPTPILSPGEPPAPTSTPLAAAVSAWPPAGTAYLRWEWLVLGPGAGLPPEVTPGPTLLLVETGTLVVLVDGTTHGWVSLADGRSWLSVHPGQGLVIAAGDRPIIHNDGAIPAVALLVTVYHVDTPGAAPPRMAS
jgi:hypothetical protein